MEYVGWFLVTLCLVPVLSLAFQVFFAFRFKEKISNSPEGRLPKVVVLIPAHNEEKVIRRTLEGYCARLDSNVEIVVIADNCDDSTAAQAKEFPVTVLERQDESKAGKGYAMQFGLEYIRNKTEEPDVVIFVDADSHLLADARLAQLGNISMTLGHPFQAGNMLLHDRSTNSIGRIKSFAWIVKNFVRPMGMRAMGFNCMLQGNGMVFPWHILRQRDVSSSNIVEDNKLAIDLARSGVKIGFVPHIAFGSFFEITQDAVSTQSRRWEGGTLALLFTELPSLLVESFRKRMMGLLGPAIELVVPPVSLLFSLLALSSSYALITGWMSEYWLLSQVMGGLILVFIVVIFAAWFGWAKSVVKLSDILSCGYYAFRKIPFYLTLIFKRAAKWERAAR